MTPEFSTPSVSVSLPYILKVTPNGTSPVCFGKNDSSDQITVLAAGSEGIKPYEDLKNSFIEKWYATIGLIRMQCAGPVNKEVSISFRREINGKVVTKKFLAPFFLHNNQFNLNLFYLEMKDLPLDGKTEILLSGAESMEMLLYPTAHYFYKGEIPPLHDSAGLDDLFLSSINSGRLYDDCIEIFNPTNEAQSMELTLTENGVECDNKALVVSNAGVKYKPEDTVYLHKVWSAGEKHPSILSVIGETAHLAIPLVRYQNAYTNQICVIRQRVALSPLKKIGALCNPISSWCIFVNINKKPLYDIESSIYWNFEHVEYNNAEEVRSLLDRLNNQKVYLEGLLEKNEFPEQ